MNECEHTREAGAYHDGELPAAAAAAFEEHVRQCVTCAGELEDLRKLSGLLGEVPEAKISSRAMAGLHRCAEEASGAGFRRMAKVVSAAAAAVVVVCSVWMWQLSAAEAEAAPAPQWEQSALRGEEFPAAETNEEQLAMWMIEKLTGNGAGD